MDIHTGQAEKYAFPRWKSNLQNQNADVATILMTFYNRLVMNKQMSGCVCMARDSLLTTILFQVVNWRFLVAFFAVSPEYITATHTKSICSFTMSCSAIWRQSKWLPYANVLLCFVCELRMLLHGKNAMKNSFIVFVALVF